MRVSTKIREALSTISHVFFISLMVLACFELFLSAWGWFGNGAASGGSPSFRDTRPAPAEGYWDEYHPYSLRWEPYVYWRRERTEGRYVNVSESGVRRTWTSKTSRTSDGPCRIWCFGGSTMWGDGARDKFTIPSHIAKILSQQMPSTNVEVVNFGEIAYVSTQEFLTLYMKLRQGERPDVVIFYDGVNDVYSAYHNKEVGLPQYEYDRRSDFNLGKRFRRIVKDKKVLAKMLLESTEIFKWAERRVRTPRPEMSEPHLSPQEKGPMEESDLKLLTDGIWQSYLFNVETAVSLCQS
ncbi:MAG: SGNH/GDSL hydrolase family protein [Desulfomonilaceae bacterium]